MKLGNGLLGQLGYSSGFALAQLLCCDCCECGLRTSLCKFISQHEDTNHNRTHKRLALLLCFGGFTISLSLSLSHAKDYSQIIQDEIETM